MKKNSLLVGLCALSIPLVALAQPKPAPPPVKPVAKAGAVPGKADRSKPPWSFISPQQEASIDAGFKRLADDSSTKQKATGEAASKILAGAAPGLARSGVDGRALAADFDAARDAAAWQAFLNKYGGAMKQATDHASKLDTAANRQLLARAAGAAVTTIRSGGVSIPSADATAIRGAQYRPLPDAGDGGVQKRGPRGETASGVPGGSSGSAGGGSPAGTATAGGSTGGGAAVLVGATGGTSLAGWVMNPGADGVVRINQLWLLGREGTSHDELHAMAPRGNHLDVTAAVNVIGSKHHWHARGEQFGLTRAGMHRAEVVFTKDSVFPTDRGTAFLTRVFTLGGYVNAEVTVSMQVLDGSSVVCSDRKSVDRRWLVAAGANWAGDDRAFWRLSCDFKHAADRPIGPYFLAVRVDAFAGGGGLGPDNHAAAAIRADVHASVKPL